jgi:transposase
LESVRKLVHKLGPVGRLRACYEAGPTGCVLYGQLTQLGVACEVIAPSLVPTKAGDRVKIDHRDATTGALLRAGELTAVWVPDASHEALRDLVRAPRSGEKGSTQSAAPGPKNIESGSTATFILTNRRRTLRRPSRLWRVPQRCSPSRVRFAAPKCAASWTAARRCGRTAVATGRLWREQFPSPRGLTQ